MTEYRRQLGELQGPLHPPSLLHSPLKKQRQVDTITERILANSKLLYKLVSALIVVFSPGLSGLISEILHLIEIF